MESMLNSVKRGVKYRIIEQSDLSGPSIIFDKKHLIAMEDEPPRVEVKIQTRKDVYLFISDKGCAIAFPSQSGFDYTGFVNEDGKNSTWVKDLFEHYWTPAELATVRCVLCSSPIRSEPIFEKVNGKEHIFDTQECVQTYKRLKQIYGEHFE
jgi:hypothetical protein